MSTSLAVMSNGFFISNSWFIFFSAALSILIFFLTLDNEDLKNKIEKQKKKLKYLEETICEQKQNYIIPADFVKTTALSVFNNSFTTQYYDIINHYRVVEIPEFPGNYRFAKKNGWILKWNNFDWLMTEFQVNEETMPESWKLIDL